MSVEQDIFRPWGFFSVKFISSTNINYGVLSAYFFKSCQYGLISSKILSNLGFYSLSGRAFCCKISWSIEAARFGFKLFQSLWNLTGASAAALLRWPSNIRAIRSLQHPISRLRVFTKSCGKTSTRLMNKGPGDKSLRESMITKPNNQHRNYYEMSPCTLLWSIFILWPF